MNKYTTKDIISVLTMSLIIANGNKDNMLHALEVAEQELDKLLETERKNAYDHAALRQSENFSTIVSFLRIDGYKEAAEKVSRFAFENNIVVETTD